MQLIYHFGYPRTGTTLLQKNLFRFHSNINYLGPKSYDENFKVLINQKEIDELEKIYLENKKNKLFYFKNLNKKINLDLFSTNKINIFSSEKYLFYSRYKRYEGLIALTDFLKEKFDLKIKIFYTIRHQYELIESIYHHSHGFLKNFLNVSSLNDLVRKIELNQIENHSNIYHFLKAYDFNFTFEEIKSKFKDAHIKIFNFKDLKNQKDKFVEDLSIFLNIDSNEAKLILENKKDNQSKIVNDKRILQSNIQRIISNNNYYKSIKFLIPSKFKKIVNNLLATKSEIKYDEEKHMRSVIENFYLKSNKEFFNKTGIKIH